MGEWAIIKCPLMVSNCLLIVLEMCPSYGHFSYSKMSKTWQGPTVGAHLIDVSSL